MRLHNPTLAEYLDYGKALTCVEVVGWEPLLGVAPKGNVIKSVSSIRKRPRQLFGRVTGKRNWIVGMSLVARKVFQPWKLQNIRRSTCDGLFFGSNSFERWTDAKNYCWIWCFWCSLSKREFWNFLGKEMCYLKCSDTNMPHKTLF